MGCERDCFGVLKGRQKSVERAWKGSWFEALKCLRHLGDFPLRFKSLPGAADASPEKSERKRYKTLSLVYDRRCV